MTGDDSSQKPYTEPTQVSEVGSEPQSTTSPEYKRHPVYSPNEWLLESISSILALGLLIGIAIIFWYMDNKPLSAWRGRVSLNATISILTTACTTALMHGVSTFIGQSKWLHFKNRPRKLADFETFDGASRGVWGSILMLATVKWNLATIGAFITILRLAFSPFAQQVVLIEQRNIITPDDTATFGYSYNYSRNILGSLSNSGVESIPQDPGMQSAIFQGLYGITKAEPFNCRGACRWTDSYISLGFKSECRNVTEETLQSLSCSGGQYDLQLCNMTTPAGLGLTTRYWATDMVTTYNMNVTSLLDPVSQTELADTWPEITRFAIYRAASDGNFLVSNVNVTDCSLFLTAYEYSGAKANGSDFSFARKREVDFGVKNPWVLEASPGGLIFQRMYTNETRDGNVTIPALETNYASISALETFFTSPTLVTEWVVGNFDNINLGVAAALSGGVNLNERFSGMATAMTDYLRYGPNPRTAYGKKVESVPFVSIRWGYFVVPIVTEAFAILFAILSIFSNRKSRRVPLWKSSTLAVLACRTEERMGLLQTTDKDLVEIQDEAETVKIRLQ
ncbi:DUF3176 domain-containing protein [Aspergillus undulatus]|uniref:DUF3176 domain-containing protein n=1 Tax=Aspergillus undulatus TaxID=1810928 RepID=UPI003CCD9C85